MESKENVSRRDGERKGQRNGNGKRNGKGKYMERGRAMGKKAKGRGGDSRRKRKSTVEEGNLKRVSNFKQKKGFLF